jgi:hypothetical protein
MTLSWKEWAPRQAAIDACDRAYLLAHPAVDEYYLQAAPAEDSCWEDANLAVRVMWHDNRQRIEQDLHGHQRLTREQTRASFRRNIHTMYGGAYLFGHRIVVTDPGVRAQCARLMAQYVDWPYATWKEVCSYADAAVVAQANADEHEEQPAPAPAPDSTPEEDAAHV